MLRFNNSNSVMEPETISKNGAGSKSRMIRGNFLKLVAAFLATGIFITSAYESVRQAEYGSCLLTEIKYNDGSSGSGKFEYNTQDCITKITDFNNKGEVSFVCTFNYNSSGDLISFEGTFIHEPASNFTYTCTTTGNKVALYRSGDVYAEIDLNAEGLPVKVDYHSEKYLTTYQYQNGNPSEWMECWHESECNAYASTYDDKKSPFFYGKTPKWLLIYLGYDSKNNKYTRSRWVEYDEYSDMFSYTYNEAGCPLTLKTTTKIKSVDGMELGGQTATTTYIYGK